VHALVIGIGWWKARQPVARVDEVKMVVREPPPPPPKPPEPPPPPPKVEEPPPVAPPKKVAIAPPPPPPKAIEPPKVTEPPKRVVGLSLESTTEGGEGPGFATGNTNQGTTDTKAVDPKLINPAPPPDAPIGVPTAPPPANKAATNIPGKGMVMKDPKRLKEVKPAYPEVLRAQGIEADVVLLVFIDATGKVTNVIVQEHAQQPEFDAAAVAAARAESYEPATRDGVAIAKTLKFTVRFRLDNP
jgi:protein TonB